MINKEFEGTRRVHHIGTVTGSQGSDELALLHTVFPEPLLLANEMQAFISNWIYSVNLTALVVFANRKYEIMLSMKTFS